MEKRSRIPQPATKPQVLTSDSDGYCCNFKHADEFVISLKPHCADGEMVHLHFKETAEEPGFGKKWAQILYDCIFTQISMN